jgi:hypothetical protein
VYFWIFFLLIVVLVVAAESKVRPMFGLAFLLTGYVVFRYAMARSDHANEWFSFTVSALMFLVPLSHRVKLTLPLSVLSVVFLFYFLAPSPAAGRIRLQIIDLFSIHRTVLPTLSQDWIEETATTGQSEWQHVGDGLTESRQGILGSGTVDVYPRELATVLRDGLRWSPRPVFQSYLAYRPWLAERNALFFADSARRPGRLLWHSSGPAGILINIDDRYLLSDEVPALLEIIRHYEPAGEFTGGFVLAEREIPLLLEEKDSERGVLAISNDDTLVTLQSVEQRGDLGIVRFDVRRTLTGSIVRALYKELVVTMLYRLENGMTVEHRIVPDMFSAVGVWLAPYIATDTQFMRFLRREENAGIRVQAIGIRFENRGHYESEIPFEFRWYEFRENVASGKMLTR